MLPFALTAVGRLVVNLTVVVLTVDVCVTTGLVLDAVVCIVVVYKAFAVEVSEDAPAGETAAAAGTLLEVRGFVAALKVEGVTVTFLVEV